VVGTEPAREIAIVVAVAATAVNAEQRRPGPLRLQRHQAGELVRRLIAQRAAMAAIDGPAMNAACDKRRPISRSILASR
jgi:hypothetical protein